MSEPNYSYNVVIDRFRVFAEGHYIIRKFTHGQIDLADMPLDGEYPFMHVVPGTAIEGNGLIQYSFDIIFADLTRDKENKAEYQREVISDCFRYAFQLLSAIKNGDELFGQEVSILSGASIDPFIEEYKNTLTGVTLSLTLEVPYDWNACEVPATYSVGGSSSGGSGTGGSGITLKVNGTNNAVQSLLDLVEGTNINIEDLGDGRVRISATGGGGGGGLTCDDLADCQTIIDIEKDITTLNTLVSGKVTANAAITAGTKTKITYDTKGLVTAGDDATTADINDSTNRRYVTDAQLTVIGNTSGTNTGDETASTIKTKLGTTTVGENLNIATNPSAVTFIRINADNTVTFLSAAQMLTAIGAQAAGTYLVASNNLSDIVSAASARTNLGATTVGANLFTLANPSAVRFLRLNADNSLSALSATDMISALGMKDAYPFGSGGVFNPADGITYYVGSSQSMAAAPSATAARRRVYVGSARFITGVDIQAFTTVTGSGETVAISVRVNNTTDHAVGNMTWNPGANSYTIINNQSLNIALATDDYWEIKIVCPTWATNPTGVTIQGTVQYTY